jgi:tRNA (guanine37-N1)-methyltransferase
VRIDIVTIFPEYLEPLTLSLVGKAREAGLVDVRVHDLRAFATDRHHTVDDSPYGGGPGMVMLAEPWGDALDSILADGSALGATPRLVVPTPSGVVLRQPLAATYSTLPWLVIACGRYEGIDSRVVEHYRTRLDVDEVSIGDYVLAGGEAAALVITEATVRLLPGVLGNEASVVDDSFAAGQMESLVEGPVFTRPATWRGLEVPEVLLSGHHGQIAAWRRDQALRRTQVTRPDIAADPAAQ